MEEETSFTVIREGMANILPVIASDKRPTFVEGALKYLLSYQCGRKGHMVPLTSVYVSGNSN